MTNPTLVRLARMQLVLARIHARLAVAEVVVRDAAFRFLDASDDLPDHPEPLDDSHRLRSQLADETLAAYA